MCHIVICGLPGSTKFARIISQTAQFSGKKVIGNKMCVLIFCTQLLYETFHILSEMIKKSILFFT